MAHPHHPQGTTTWPTSSTTCTPYASPLALLIRARLFRYTSQVACALTAGLGAVAALLSPGPC